ncbi:MAG: hypothetical protein ACRC8D_15185 [Aeromonas sp.]
MNKLLLVATGAIMLLFAATLYVLYDQDSTQARVISVRPVVRQIPFDERDCRATTPCQTSSKKSPELLGYNVIYSLYGQEHLVRLIHRPGTTLEIRNGKVQP